MGMRYFQAHYGYTHTLALYCAFEGTSYLAGKGHKTIVGFVIEVKDVIYLLLGNYQCVTLGHRTDVEERKETIVLGYFVARYFTGYNTTEN
jgi:hypothetical protein